MNALCTLAKQYGPLAGRTLLALMFVLAGINKIGGFAGTAGWMASKGLPASEALLVLTIIVEIGAGLMLITGWKARWGAAALFGFTALASLIFHPFWAVPAAQQQMEMILFMKNLAVMGGMLYIMACGPGPYSLGRDDC